jgi:hypothetical protein
MAPVRSGAAMIRRKGKSRAAIAAVISRSIFRCQLPIRRKDSLRYKESAVFFR